MPKLRIKQDHQTTTLNLLEGETILECLTRHRIDLENPCHGNGTCGKCRVRIVSGDPPAPTATEKAFHLPDTIRLACFVKPDADLTIELSETGTMNFLEEDYAALLNQAGDLPAGITAICDIGTTTLQILLIRPDGKLLDTVSSLNPQKSFGLDVLTRIAYAAESEDQRRELTRGIQAAVLDLLQTAFARHGIDADELATVCCVGNPTMIHLLLGISPASLGRAPYELTLKDAVCKPLTEAFAESSAAASVFTKAELLSFPLASAYIGSDVLAGAVYTDLATATKPTLLVDIGTNGELLLAKDGKIYAASCATGPALEGMNLSCGMRAEEGAAEDVRCDLNSGNLTLSVIGGGTARGLCGSGVLSVVREGLRIGLINVRGQLLRTGQIASDDPRRAFLTTVSGRSAIRLTDDLYFTAKDIRQVQLAKTALLAGINALLERAEVTPDELDKIYVAGQFGYHLNPDILLNCGLVPPVAPSRLHYLGNTALKGTLKALCHPEAREHFMTIGNIVTTVPLSLLDNYDRYFIEASSFPNIQEVGNHDKS